MENFHPSPSHLYPHIYPQELCHTPPQPLSYSYYPSYSHFQQPQQTHSPLWPPPKPPYHPPSSYTYYQHQQPSQNLFQPYPQWPTPPQPHSHVWEEYPTLDGRKYYYNTFTKEYTWTPPSLPPEEPPPSLLTPSQPPPFQNPTPQADHPPVADLFTEIRDLLLKLKGDLVNKPTDAVDGDSEENKLIESRPLENEETELFKKRKCDIGSGILIAKESKRSRKKSRSPLQQEKEVLPAIPVGPSSPLILHSLPSSAHKNRPAFITMGKTRGIGSARKLKSHRRRQRWTDKSYKKSHLGNEWKKPFAGSSHAKRKGRAYLKPPWEPPSPPLAPPPEITSGKDYKRETEKSMVCENSHCVNEFFHKRDQNFGSIIYCEEEEGIVPQFGCGSSNLLSFIKLDPTVSKRNTVEVENNWVSIFDLLTQQSWPFDSIESVAKFSPAGIQCKSYYFRRNY